GDGRLLRSARDGHGRIPAYLDDHAAVALGLLDLYTATGERRWLAEAERLGATVRERVADAEGGGLFHTSADAGQLGARHQGPGASPPRRRRGGGGADGAAAATAPGRRPKGAGAAAGPAPGRAVLRAGGAGARCGPVRARHVPVATAGDRRCRPRRRSGDP